jgi:hypothetical protein
LSNASSRDAAAELLAELATPDFASCPDAMLVTSRSDRTLLNVDRALQRVTRLLNTERILMTSSHVGILVAESIVNAHTPESRMGTVISN